ncbi:hypothetical protein AVEN_121253-1 [Araneus ventricosus]|uniref:Uncharacterized protein n=1 Tax=Araneus ventricosus TaxID=182803 RepID=A0A4Y2KYM6_ARAVE|nr:hypothetical protein AVEN_121253-1 [Araneus ventricosus]
MEEISQHPPFQGKLAAQKGFMLGSTVKPRESELIGADLRSDSGEFELSGKFGEILSICQMQSSIDSGCSVKACGKGTRRFARYSGEQVESKKKISEHVSTH